MQQITIIYHIIDSIEEISPDKLLSKISELNSDQRLSVVFNSSCLNQIANDKNNDRDFKPFFNQLKNSYQVIEILNIEGQYNAQQSPTPMNLNHNRDKLFDLTERQFTALKEYIQTFLNDYLEIIAQIQGQEEKTRKRARQTGQR